MTSLTKDRLSMATNGVREPIGPDDPDLRAGYEALIAADYDWCHPDDTFEAMKFRARFSKEDQGLLKEWMTLAAARANQAERVKTSAASSRLAA